MIKIIMNSGKEYKINDSVENFTSKMKTQIGIPINGFKEVEKGIVINPTHISSIDEIIERPTIDDTINSNKLKIDLSTLT